MTVSRTPHYPLEEIQRGVGKGAYAITLRAAADAASLHFDEEDVRDCILMLEPGGGPSLSPSREMKAHDQKGASDGLLSGL